MATKQDFLKMEASLWLNEQSKNVAECGTVRSDSNVQNYCCAIPRKESLIEWGATPKQKFPTKEKTGELPLWF